MDELPLPLPVAAAVLPSASDTPLVASHSAATALASTGDPPIGAPQRLQKERQDRFLAAYGQLGTVTHSAKAAGCDSDVVYLWLRTDAQGFKARYEAAKLVHRDYLESMMFDRLAAQKPSDNPILLIFALKGAWPEKYRDTVTIADDNSKEMAALLRKLHQERRQKQQQEPGPGDTDLGLPLPDDSPATGPAINRRTRR